MADRTRSRRPHPKRGAAAKFLGAAVTAATDDCIRWPFSTDGGGYGQIRIDGKLMQAHRVALERAKGPAPEPTMQAAHAALVCHDRLCINPRHLRWATRTENMADTVADDTHRRGVRSNMARLTEGQVRAIRSDARAGAAIADDYSISVAQVSQIRNRKRWAWLD